MSLLTRSMRNYISARKRCKETDRTRSREREDRETEGVPGFVSGLLLLVLVLLLDVSAVKRSWVRITRGVCVCVRACACACVCV
jgi:hypothetical protein